MLAEASGPSAPGQLAQNVQHCHFCTHVYSPAMHGPSARLMLPATPRSVYAHPYGPPATTPTALNTVEYATPS